MNQWIEFEELATQIYREMEPGAKVIHNDKILGVESGSIRQIDVSIRYTIGGHDLLMVVQAKDYDRPADINVVGEFASVIKDVRANKGILICKSGFTKKAAKLAYNLGIDICNIHDAESIDWRLKIQLPILWIDLLPKVSLGLIASFEKDDSIPNDPQKWIISNDMGKTRILPFATFVRLWNQRLIPQDVGKLHSLNDPQLKTIKIATRDLYGKIVWREIAEIKITYTVSQRAWIGSFTPDECRGILNYNNGQFLVSYLPIGAIPKTRDETWKEIDDPTQLVISTPGMLVTTEKWQID